MKDLLYKSKIWETFKTSKLNNNKQITLESRVNLAIRLSVILGIGVLMFSAFYLIRNFPIPAYINFILGSIILLNIYFLKKTENIDRSFSNVLILIYFVIINSVFADLGFINLVWFCVFPIVTFFLKGKHKSFIWIAVLIISIVLIGIFQLNQLITTVYSLRELSHIIFITILISALVYFYQDINNNYETIVNKNSKELVSSVDQLLHEINERKNVETRLDSAVKEMELKNQLLEDTKKAMLNLLEDLRTAKETVEQEKAKDEAILENIGDGLIVTDDKEIVLLSNKQAENLLGWVNSEILGKRLSDVVQIEDESGKSVDEHEPIQQALKDGKHITNSSYYYKKKDGTKFPVYITVSPVIIDEKIIGSIIIFRDITKEKEVDRAKTEFVSLASHQLRTPLTAINWYAEMLLSEDAGKVNNDQRIFIDEIYRGNKRMIDLVNALLNVSRIDLGTFAVDPKPTNIIEISDIVLEELEPLIESKSTKIVKDYDANIPILEVDPQLTRIVFQNLLSNAVKYTPPKGEVKVKISADEKNLKVVISDTGYGIPINQQTKIFTKLFRADNAIEKETDGTGLGLYIVKSIVEHSDGKIWFESVENKGTTFYVTIPLTGMKKKAGAKGLS